MSDNAIPLIGRRNEIDRLTQYIECWGELYVICISGAGGIGKTRLLQEIQLKYLDAGHVILSQEDDQKKSIILVQPSDLSEWSKEFTEGVESMSEEFGVKLHVIKLGSDKQGMESQLQEVIAQAPDALIIREGNNESVKECIPHAIDRQIRVLTFDNYLPNIEGLATRVIHDERAGIQKSAQQLLENIHFRGEIGVIRGRSALQNQRVSVFEDFMHYYPDITRVEVGEVDEYGTHNIIAAAASKTEEMLVHCPGIRAIWAPWNEFAKGVVQKLKDLRRSDIPIYSFDLASDDIPLMLDHKSPWKATLVTEPWKSGRIVVRLAMRAILGESLAPYYHLVPRVISQEDLQHDGKDMSFLKQDSDDEYWTPELQALRSREKLFLHIPKEILDFDDRSLRNPEKMERTIANMLDTKIIEPFLRLQADYSKMQHAQVSLESLRIQQREVERAFVKCCNTFTKQKRTLLLFDTTDDLEPGKGIWQDFEQKLPLLQNAVVLIAGRNADKIGESLKKTSLADRVVNRDLKPLSFEDSLSYLQIKQAQKSVTVAKDVAEKLIFWADGRPIFIDLAVELWAREISFDWLIDERESLESFQALEPEIQLQRLKEFEKALVNHIKDLWNPMQHLILLMAYVFPVNNEMIRRFLNLGLKEVKKLCKQVKNVVFIKFLPNGYLKLHDEMRRMVWEYVWPEVDPESYRRKKYSELALIYLADEIKKQVEHVEVKRRELIRMEKLPDTTNIVKDPQKILELSLNIQEMEESLWLMREQLLHHALFTNIGQGLTVFAELFEEATKSSRFRLRQQMFDELQKYDQHLSASQKTILDIYQAKLFSSRGRYEEAREFCQNILQRKHELSLEYQLETLILQGNIKIRQGNVKEGFNDFKCALNISESNYNDKKLAALWVIRSQKEFGWAYRLRGDLKSAEEYYEKARRLCLRSGGPEKREFQYDYGMILNNLVFVLSNSNKTRESALALTHSMIDHWKMVGDTLGLGAGYLVSGIAYYRNDRQEKALDDFERARQIFEPLRDYSRLGEIYSWRGATYRVLGKFEDAKKDLEHSLEIGTQQFKAMTLNRLGRVYMSLEDWENAEKYIIDSIEAAQNTHDFIYWVVSRARQISIAAEKKEKERLDELERLLQEDLSKIENPDKNNLGVAYTNATKKSPPFSECCRKKVAG